MSIIYDALLSLHAEMFLDRAVAQFRLEKIKEEIDEALKNGDQDAFYTLTSELNSIRGQIENSPSSNQKKYA
ncbi:IDEAL domain-containing protein [Marinicrinis lubricantis]|uniref:IDEAL domain-containing protein n=1 Tax=Marinicrinis lubricantis TaxID=2086470 RepID=A0ABW1IM06_9BACL